MWKKTTLKTTAPGENTSEFFKNFLEFSYYINFMRNSEILKTNRENLKNYRENSLIFTVNSNFAGIAQLWILFNFLIQIIFFNFKEFSL